MEDGYNWTSPGHMALEDGADEEGEGLEAAGLIGKDVVTRQVEGEEDAHMAMCSVATTGLEYPVSLCDRADNTAYSADYGQFVAFLETKRANIVCLQQGHGERVVYDSPCLPLTPPAVCTPYDDVQHKQLHPAPGAKFKAFKDTPFTNVGGLQMQLAATSDDSATHTSFSKWSHDCAPLSMVSIEAYTLPGKIRHIHSQKVQEKVMLCCHSNYHVTLLEARVPMPSGGPILQCVSVYSSDSVILHTQLSPYIAGEIIILQESGCLSLRRKGGEIKPLPFGDQKFILCCYGSQPRSFFLSTSDNLYQMDIRDTNSAGELVTLLSGHKVTCLSRDISHPFRVLVATEQALFLLDTRQPTHQLLAVQHQLSNFPISLSCLQTQAGKTMVLLTSAKNCECVVICYNGQHSPPYFALRPHTITAPSDQLHALRGLSVASCLPLVAWRFSQPAAGSTLIPIGKAKFAAVLLTSHGDLFYQIWHYQSGQLLSSFEDHCPSFSLSLDLGYSLWFKEAGYQQQELSHYKDLPSSAPVDMDPLLQYLVSAPKELCLFCHRVHTQNFPELDISQYMQSYPPADMADSNLDCGQHQRCSFCHELMNPRVPAQTQSLTSADGSGLDSLRAACAVRLPQNELEFSLAGGWTVGGTEIQKNIFPSAITPKHCEGETDAAAVKQHQVKGKATPTPKASSKIRRIGF